MSFRRERRSLFILLVVLGLLAASGPVLGQVADNKTYTAHFTGKPGPADEQSAEPDVFAGDADALIEMTITNTSSSQSLGSADVTVPGPFFLRQVQDADGNVLDVAPGATVIELRFLGLAPDDSTTFTLTVDVQTCNWIGSPPTFEIAAKQSNEFNGTGNDFFLDAGGSDLQVDVVGTCALAFVQQPGDAEAGAVITSVDYDTGGAVIAVAVRDAGNTGNATHTDPEVHLTACGTDAVLQGTTSATVGDGVADFSPGPKLSISAFDYTLVASTIENVDCPSPASDPAFTHAVSAPFDIVDARVDCPAGQPCTGVAEVQRDGQSVTAEFGSDVPEGGGEGKDANLLVSLGAADTPSFECAGYTPRAVHTAQFLVVGASGDDAGEDVGGDRVGVVTITVPDVSQPVKSYEVCWAAPYPFTTDGGTWTEPSDEVKKPGTGEALHVGQLPDCPMRGEPARPCISERELDRRSKALTIRIETTGADPWVRA